MGMCTCVCKSTESNSRDFCWQCDENVPVVSQEITTFMLASWFNVARWTQNPIQRLLWRDRLFMASPVTMSQPNKHLNAMFSRFHLKNG